MDDKTKTAQFYASLEGKTPEEIKELALKYGFTPEMQNICHDLTVKAVRDAHKAISDVAKLAEIIDPRAGAYVIGMSILQLARAYIEVQREAGKPIDKLVGIIFGKANG